MQNKHLPQERRWELFRTLVLSKLSYGMESWTLSDWRTKEYIHNALLRLYRRLLAVPHGVHITDGDLLVRLGANSPTEILRLLRLRYLGTLHKRADLVPWGLLNQDTSWCQLIQDDMRWLWEQLRASSSLPDPAHGFAVWEDLWLHHASYWKRLVRRGGEHAILQRRRHHRVEHFHQRFVPLLSTMFPGGFDFKVDASTPFGTPRNEAAEIHACMACRKVFRSKGGLGAHLFRHHGQVSRLRLLFDTTSCRSCMKEYHTFSKLLAHLRYSTTCRERLWGSRVRVPPAEGTGSHGDRELCAVHDRLLPPLPAQGPQLPPVPARPLPDYDLHLVERIYQALIDRSPDADVAQIIADLVLAFAGSWTMCCASLSGRL